MAFCHFHLLSITFVHLFFVRLYLGWLMTLLIFVTHTQQWFCHVIILSLIVFVNRDPIEATGVFFCFETIIAAELKELNFTKKWTIFHSKYRFHFDFFLIWFGNYGSGNSIGLWFFRFEISQRDFCFHSYTSCQKINKSTSVPIYALKTCSSFFIKIDSSLMGISAIVSFVCVCVLCWIFFPIYFCSILFWLPHRITRPINEFS